MDRDLSFEMAKLRQSAVIDCLNERRKIKNISLRKLASESGMSHTTINDIFRKEQVKLWQMFILADALGMSLTELMFLGEERYREMVSDQFGELGQEVENGV